MNTSLLVPGSVTSLFIVHLLRTLRVAMRIIARVGISIPLLVWCSCAFSLNPNQTIHQLYHSSWTAKQGISGNVTALAQTSDGYLWVGTSDRLLRFNGISFESYRPEVGTLAAASVSALLAAPDGGLWIGYTRGGASFLKNGRITNYSDSDGFPVSTVRRFAQDHSGTTWAAAVGGLARLEGSRWRLLNPDKNNPYSTAWSLLVDRGGTLWVASGNEIFFLPPREERFVRTGARCGAGCVLLQGPDGAIIFYDNEAKGLRAIRRSHGGSREVFPGINVSVRSAVFDRDGGIWVGGDGLSRLSFPFASTRHTFRPTAQKFGSSDGLSNDAVESIIEDREGNIWVGTDGGLDRFRNRNVTWFPLKGGPFSLVAGPDGSVWAGSRGSSIPLVRADDARPVIPGAKEVYNAYHDPDGSIWLSANRTLLHWQNGRVTRVPVPEQVKKLSSISNPPDPIIASAITKDHSNDLWVAFGGSGEFRLHNNTWTFVPILKDHPDWSAGYAFTDSSDCIWLFWGDRIAQYDHGKVQVFDATDGLAIGPPEAIAERNHVLWVGGESGLAFLRAGHFYPIQSTENSGFSSVTGIVVTENGDVWLSTGPGIIHIPNNEIDSVIEHPEHKVQFELFDLTSDLPDGIQRTGEVYCPGAVEAGDGSLWFATERGAVRIDPSHISRNSVPPPVSISAMAADNRSYPVHSTISLPALTQNVVIHYDALSLAVPERVRFRYKLDGWDKEWHEAGGRREAYFTHLAPGTYTLHVIASNNDGVWNTTGATLNFVVAAAWYQTYWLYAICVAAALILLWILYRLRLQQIARAISARFDERLAERTRIARDFHDTFLQTIQGSKMVADDALDFCSDPTRTQHALKQLSSWLDQATTESRAALNSLRLSATVRNDLAEALQRASENSGPHGSMAVTFSMVGNPQEMHPIVRDEIYRIGYEAIRNAQKHSRGSRLEIEIRYGQDLTVLVQDNGVGMDPAVTDHGKAGHFGLDGMRERAARICGKLTIISSASSGTRVTLTVPGAIAFSATKLDMRSRVRFAFKNIFRP